MSVSNSRQPFEMKRNRETLEEQENNGSVIGQQQQSSTASTTTTTTVAQPEAKKSHLEFDFEALLKFYYS